MGNREFWLVIAVAIAALIAIMTFIHNPVTITWTTLNPAPPALPLSSPPPA